MVPKKVRGTTFRMTYPYSPFGTSLSGVTDPLSAILFCLGRKGLVWSETYFCAGIRVPNQIAERLLDA